MIPLSVNVQLAELKKDFGTLQNKQAPFAVRWAANATVNDASDKVSLSIRRSFSAGSTGMSWIQRHVKALRVGSNLAREHGGSGAAAVGIIPPGGRSSGRVADWTRYRGSLVPLMELGGPTPGPRRFGGAGQSGQADYGRYAIPIRRKGQPSPYPKELYPVNLGLSSRTGISKRTKGGALRGKQRTYMVRMLNSPGNAMVFQRFGNESDATQPLFWTQRETRVPRRPYFFATAEASITLRFPIHFGHAMEQALFGRGAYRG